MLGFEPDNSDIISFNLKMYEDEDMVWIYNEVINTNHKTQRSSKNSPRYFENIDSYFEFDEIREDIKIELSKITCKDELNLFFEDLKHKKTTTPHLSTLKEIKTNKRLCNFIYNFICNNKKEDFNFNFKRNAYLNITYYLLTNTSDLNHNNRIYNLDKIKTIIKAKDKFNEEIVIKKNNKSKHLQNTKFHLWAYVYLKNDKNLKKHINYIPNNEDDYHQYILSFLDYLACFEEIIHENTTNKIYKAWSQKKFREDDKLKKHYHLPLTKKAKKELEIISKIENKSENKVLEQLIHNFYLKIACDEKGKCLYES